MLKFRSSGLALMNDDFGFSFFEVENVRMLSPSKQTLGTMKVPTLTSFTCITKNNPLHLTKIGNEGIGW